MGKRSDKLYIKDILDSIEKIEKYVYNLNYEEFSENSMAIDAIVRNLEIIGEATKSLSRQLKSLSSEIPWKEMAGMRNKITHEYFGVNLKIVWKTIRERLPELKESISEILDRINKDKQSSLL